MKSAKSDALKFSLDSASRRSFHFAHCSEFSPIDDFNLSKSVRSRSKSLIRSTNSVEFAGRNVGLNASCRGIEIFLRVCIEICRGTRFKISKTSCNKSELTTEPSCEVRTIHRREGVPPSLSILLRCANNWAAIALASTNELLFRSLIWAT